MLQLLEKLTYYNFAGVHQALRVTPAMRVRNQPELRGMDARQWSANDFETMAT